MATTHRTSGETGMRALERVPWLETMMRRRSRRFALGGRMTDGPLAYESGREAVPLTLEEEAVIVFAATGVTGFSLGDLPYGPHHETGGGHIMFNPIARTIPSPDGINTVMPFVVNDDGAFAIRRPGDYAKTDVAGLVERAQRHEFAELYERGRIRLANKRVGVPRELPWTPPFNRWSANVPGSTYFVLVSELTTLALTLLFLILSEEMGYFIYDERNGYKPAGVTRFGKSQGGHLNDNPNDLVLATVNDLESYVMEMVAVEQGLMLQSMQLAVEAMGLGGFPHYGAQKWSWFEAFGFTMDPFRLSKLTCAGPVKSRLMSAAGKNPELPVALGLEVGGEPVLKPFCPPWYPSMEAAVHAFVDSKFADGSGTFRDGSDLGAWNDPRGVTSEIARYTDRNVDAVVAYCEYIYGRYGRFLGGFGPVRNLMAYQVHHVDTEFYDRLYRPGAYQDAHRDHFALWHGE